MDGWNASFLLETTIFRVYVSFREGISSCHGWNMSPFWCPGQVWASWYGSLEEIGGVQCCMFTTCLHRYETCSKYMGVSTNRDTPKWMVNIMENPIKIDDLGGTPYFWKHPCETCKNARRTDVLFGWLGGVIFWVSRKFCPSIRLTFCPSWKLT